MIRVESRSRLSSPIPEIRALADRVDEEVQEALGEASVVAALEVVEVGMPPSGGVGAGPKGPLWK